MSSEEKEIVATGEQPDSVPVWNYCLFSGLFSVLAFPPYGIWPLAFLAPIGWIRLIDRSDRSKKVSYFWIWFIGMIQWAAVFHFLRLPHWAGWLGIPLMGGYFSLFTVAFVAFSRSLTHRWKIPLVLAAPIVWTGLEAVRATFLSGFPIAMWGHSLYTQSTWIQIADLGGEITVSFFLISVAASLVGLLGQFFRWMNRLKLQSFHLILNLGVLLFSTGFTFWYGSACNDFYQAAGPLEKEETAAKVLLLQGTQDVRFGLSAKQYQEEQLYHYREHFNLIQTARLKHDDIAVVVWPESMFPSNDFMPLDGKPVDPKLEKEFGITEKVIEKQIEVFRKQSLQSTGYLLGHETALANIAGCRTIDPTNDDTFNAAVFVDPSGKIQNRYFKTHLVPFGEYLPFGGWFPSLYQLSPMKSALTVGHGETVFDIQGKKILPVICFESMMGNFIRGYFIRTQKANGKPVDAMVTLTNDGWYWGSSALDLHLASNVFRAVENRTPHLVAANTGLSAEISPAGKIKQSVERRTAGGIVCNVNSRNANWQPLWWTVGNWPWFTAFALSAGLWLIGWFGKKEDRIDHE